VIAFIFLLALYVPSPFEIVACFPSSFPLFDILEQARQFFPFPPPVCPPPLLIVAITFPFSPCDGDPPTTSFDLCWFFPFSPSTVVVSLSPLRNTPKNPPSSFSRRSGVLPFRVGVKRAIALFFSVMHQLKFPPKYFFSPPIRELKVTPPLPSARISLWQCGVPLSSSNSPSFSEATNLSPPLVLDLPL